MEQLVVYCTCPDWETAERIANTLVAEQLAACVNIVPGVTSIYRWQEQLQQDAEWLLMIKTNAGIYGTLEARIDALHPYDVAEIIALPIVRGSPEYRAWLDASIKEAKP